MRQRERVYKDNQPHIHQRGKKGFTLVEVLVSITLLTTVIFWPVSIIAQILTFTTATKETIQAHLLAQSTIEHVRAVRDNTFLSIDIENWFSDLHKPYDANNAPYSGCVSYVDDVSIVDGAMEYPKYCVPQCDGSACTKGTNAFVDGVSSGDVRGTANSQTCDGRAPKADGELSPTLTLVIPDKTSSVQYVNAVSCVSWRDQKSNSIRKVEFKEAMYEWILRRNTL